jgi:hypothetical protein
MPMNPIKKGRLLLKSNRPLVWDKPRNSLPGLLRYSNQPRFETDSIEAVPKCQILEQLLTPGENCISHKYLPYKELSIFSKSLFQNQPGFGTSSII